MELNTVSAEKKKYAEKNKDWTAMQKRTTDYLKIK